MKDRKQVAESLERFVINARNIAASKHKETIVSLAKTAETPQEGFTKALYFVIRTVYVGLKRKSVEIPAEMMLMPNGVISEVAQDVLGILVAEGFTLSEQELSNGMSQTFVLVEELIQGKPSEAQSEGIQDEVNIYQGSEIPQNQPAQPKGLMQ